MQQMYRKTILPHTFFPFNFTVFIPCSYTLIYNNTSKQTPLPRTPSQPRKLSYAAPPSSISVSRMKMQKSSSTKSKKRKKEENFYIILVF